MVLVYSEHFDVMTSAFGRRKWGSYGAVDAMVEEAKEQLKKYLEITRDIEEITHSREIAQHR